MSPATNSSPASTPASGKKRSKRSDMCWSSWSRAVVSHDATERSARSHRHCHRTRLGASTEMSDGGGAQVRQDREDASVVVPADRKAKLAEDGADVSFDSPLRQPEPSGYRCVRSALRH